MNAVNPLIRFSDTESKPGQPVTFRVDLLPLSLNYWSRAFWTVRAREAADTKIVVHAALGVKLRQWVMLNGVWFKEPVSIALVYYIGEKIKTKVGIRRRHANLDVDNLVPKHIIDAMKGVLIADDNRKLVPLVSQEAVDVSGVGGYTVVTVAPYSRAW